METFYEMPQKRDEVERKLHVSPEGLLDVSSQLPRSVTSPMRLRT